MMARKTVSLFTGKSCGKGSFTCQETGTCVPESFKCDGEDDWAPWDKSDEKEADCLGIKCAAPGADFPAQTRGAVFL